MKANGLFNCYANSVRAERRLRVYFEITAAETLRAHAVGVAVKHAIVTRAGYSGSKPLTPRPERRTTL